MSIPRLRLRENSGAIALAFAIGLTVAALIAVALSLVGTGARPVDRVGGIARILEPGADAFAVQVTGREGAAWVPGESDWEFARTDGFDVPATEGTAFGPGASRTFTLGVRNASPELPGVIVMRVLNRTPENAKLFDRLLYTVELRGELLLDRVPGNELGSRAPLDLGGFAPQESKTMRFTVTMPEDAGNDLQRASARVRIDMRGESR